MAGKVILFRNPDLPLEGSGRLRARRAYRVGIKGIAALAVAQAFTKACEIKGTKGLGIDDAAPMFVAAMRRELRKSGLF